MWRSYKNINGDSSVVAYRIDLVIRNIFVRFDNGRFREYLYEESRIGEENYNNMIRLAELGEGLCSYIQNYVRNDYSWRG